jgi:hypothetical protein
MTDNKIYTNLTWREIRKGLRDDIPGFAYGRFPLS